MAARRTRGARIQIRTPLWNAADAARNPLASSGPMRGGFFRFNTSQHRAWLVGGLRPPLQREVIRGKAKGGETKTKPASTLEGALHLFPRQNPQKQVKGREFCQPFKAQESYETETF